ncbi:MAG: hypothetical protein HFJ41_03820 [Clostridia bacterium]|nr:hypothetical protein [Clostridia bacterium]
MKVPEKIKKEIYKCANAYSKATFSECTIRTWLGTKGLDNENNIEKKHIIDAFIDCIIYTNAPGAFIEILENLEEK